MAAAEERSMFSTLIKGAMLAVTAMMLGASGTSAAVFQYRIALSTDRGERSAFLWVPAEAASIRGVVMGGMTLMEREFVKDPQIRRACVEQRLAIVFLKCGLGSVEPQDVLDRFAAVSGYGELSVAPVMFVGHSAGGPQAKVWATKMHERCFGLVQYRGGTPGGSDSVPGGVPVLMMTGQFDEFGGTMRDAGGRETWEGGRDALAAYRAANPGNLASIVVEPGAGHFAWSDRNAAYLAMFIGKAAEYCIPQWQAGAKEPVQTKQIGHRDGWLSDLCIEAPELPPAQWEAYGGDRSWAAWHFDREMAEATVAYHAGGFGKKDQFIEWEDPYWVDAGTRFFFTRIEWVGDGQEFRVHPAYAEQYPSQHKGRGPRWLEAGKPVGHAGTGIFVRQVSGPVVVAGPNTLRMRYDNLAAATERSRVTFMAYSRGDSEYRYTEQVGMMPRGFSGLKKGDEQTITFPSVPDLVVGGDPVRLDATSTSGLAVEYYVACGPARVEKGMLRIAELPVRARLPVEVRVVAYQFGSGIEPLVRTAVPVERVTQIRRP